MKYWIIALCCLVSSLSFASSKEKSHFVFSSFAATSQGDSALFYRQDGASFCVCLDKVGTGCTPTLAACSSATYLVQADISFYGDDAEAVAEGFMDGLNLSGVNGNLTLTEYFNGTVDVENTIAGPTTDATSNGSISSSVLTQGSN